MQMSTTSTHTRNTTAAMIPGTSRCANSGKLSAVAAASPGIIHTWAATRSASITAIRVLSTAVTRGCISLPIDKRPVSIEKR